MLENIRYENHLGETIRFDGTENIIAAHSDLRDWSLVFDGDKFTFDETVEKSVPLKIFGTADKVKATRNRLFEIVNADTTAGEYGHLWFDDYYMLCYIAESKKSRYMADYGTITVKIWTDNPYWIKETTLEFRKTGVVESGLKYNRKYNYQYTDYSFNQTVTNEALSPAPFRMKIYGAASSPDVAIGNQHYQVNTSLLANQYLTLTAIDKEKTIILTDQYGGKTNLFNNRNKNYDVFAPIPNGTFAVTWDGTFDFDLTVLDRRSEPPWT